MFFDWFGAKVSGVSGFSEAFDAAAAPGIALDVIPILLWRRSSSRSASPSSASPTPLEPSFTTVVAGLGGLGAADPLPDHRPPTRLLGGVSVDIALKIGIFLGLIAADAHRLRRLQRDARGRDDLRRQRPTGSRTRRPEQSPASRTPPPRPPPPPPPGRAAGLPAAAAAPAAAGAAAAVTTAPRQQPPPPPPRPRTRRRLRLTPSSDWGEPKAAAGRRRRSRWRPAWRRR